MHVARYFSIFFSKNVRANNGHLCLLSVKGVLTLYLTIVVYAKLV